MVARQRSIICTIGLLALIAASANAVEFVVTDGGKLNAKKAPTTKAAHSASSLRQVRQVDNTELQPVEMLSPPSSGVSYPDPSVPFLDAFSPTDLPEMTVALEPPSIHDPAPDGRPIKASGTCNSCGETSSDGSCNCHGANATTIGSGCTDRFAGELDFDSTSFGGPCNGGYGGTSGCAGGNCGGGRGLLSHGLSAMSGLTHGIGSLGSGMRGNNCNSSSCRGCDSPGWFLNFWTSQGYTYNAEDPASGSNLPQTFNDRSNKYLFNQAYLSFGRAVSTCSWDLGGRIDLLYGSDYFFTQANGLETNRDGTPHWNSSDGPRGRGASIYGLALPQAYVELGVPIGVGTSIKVGHFYTTLGYESVMAPENFFYSHAYTMQYGEPFTHTGVLADVGITQSFSLLSGVTNGWNNWENPNDELGYLFGFSWCASPLASISFGVHTGREDAAGVNDRSVYSLVYTRQVSSRLQYVFQHDFGTEANAETDRALQSDSAKWYGINQYLFYEMSDRLTLGARVEWFRDQDNARVIAIPSETLVEGGNYVGVSLGANYRPNCRWIFRPEIRWDWSDVAATGLGGTGMYNDFRDDNQLTLAGDVIFRF